MVVRRRILCNERKRLLDSTFAYIDPQTGRRYLPIIDKTHTLAAIMAIGRWNNEDPAKWIAMRKIAQQANKFGLKIPNNERYTEPWNVS